MPKKSELTKKDLVLFERRVVFWEEYKEGKSFRQIAMNHDVSSSTVSSDIKAFVRELKEEGLRHVEEYRIVHQERIAVAVSAIWDRVLEGKMDAINTLIRLLERESRLLGLDAPTKVDITAKIRALAVGEGIHEDEAYEIAEGVYKEIAG